ncbi:hypothetical protein BCR39DRAFT_587849 [Naematelia encephala]|uniref:Uncharacterized protein n=1 Tax=Naematelia encephala TaxID=71784 RepID=A0A1Y2B6X0_9TREE|nr:hypothetical protein BCR39DRAFT_587849 [Naematelia encephala]
MESLSPECTPLKQRYDACFNSWFEGYLQPALDAAQNPSARLFSGKPVESKFSSPSGSSSPVISAPPDYPANGRPPPPVRAQLVTSWSAAFPSRITNPRLDVHSPVAVDGSLSPDFDHGSQTRDAVPVDTTGQTRAQIKAAEYERACGAAWKAYRSCLGRAIAQNTSLSNLLEQARAEHPLEAEQGLEGTAWDPRSDAVLP